MYELFDSKTINIFYISIYEITVVLFWIFI